MRDVGKVNPNIHGPLKGRGAASYVPGRYEKTVVDAEDDGWGSVYAGDVAHIDEASISEEATAGAALGETYAIAVKAAPTNMLAPRLRTDVTEERARQRQLNQHRRGYDQQASEHRAENEPRRCDRQQSIAPPHAQFAFSDQRRRKSETRAAQDRDQLKGQRGQHHTDVPAVRDEHPEDAPQTDDVANDDEHA